MTVLEELIVRVGGDTDDAEKAVGGLSGAIDRNFGKITAAGAVAGAGLEAFARKVKPLNEANSRLAAMTGLSSDAMRDLTLETSNVTFPLDEAQSLLETAAQRGLEGGEALQSYAQFWDMVGDATGEAGPALGEAGVALAAVGVAAGQEEQALGALGFVTESTTSSVGEFLDFLERTGPELGELGADVDDAAAILGVMEREMGLSGRTARTEFRTAVSEADGDMATLLETLGISADQFAAYRDEVDASSDVIERNADIHADSFTPLERLTHAAEELMFRYGGLADAAGALALPMLALGPIAKLGSLAFGKIGKAALRSGVSFVKTAAVFVASGARMTATMLATATRVVAGWVLMAVQSLLQAARMAIAWIIAMGPIALIIAAVIGLVVLIVKNWDKIVAFTKKAFTFVWNFLKGLWDKIVGFIGKAIGVIKDVFFKFTPLGIIIKNWEPIKRFISNTWNSIISFIKGLPRKIGRAARRMWDGIKAAFKSMINFVIRGWNNLSFTAPRVSLGPLGTFGGFTIGTPNIPLLAGGGIITRPTLALLGEGGRDEAVIPLPRGMRDQVRGGDGQSIVIRGDGTSRAAFIIDEIRHALRTSQGFRNDIKLAVG